MYDRQMKDQYMSWAHETFTSLVLNERVLQTAMAKELVIAMVLVHVIRGFGARIVVAQVAQDHHYNAMVKEPVAAVIFVSRLIFVKV